MKEALKQAVRHSEEHEKTCPACGSEQVESRGTKQRVLLTCFGRVEFPLKRSRCRECQQWFRPAETCLAKVKGHTITERLRELAALMGSSCPYETAAGVLKQLSEVQLSDTSHPSKRSLAMKSIASTSAFDPPGRESHPERSV